MKWVKVLIVAWGTAIFLLGCSAQIEEKGEQQSLAGELSGIRHYGEEGEESLSFSIKSELGQVVTLSADEADKLIPLVNQQVSIQGLMQNQTMSVTSVQSLSTNITQQAVSTQNASPRKRKLLYIVVSYKNSNEFCDKILSVDQIVNALNKTIEYSSYGAYPQYAKEAEGSVYLPVHINKNLLAITRQQYINSLKAQNPEWSQSQINDQVNEFRKQNIFVHEYDEEPMQLPDHAKHADYTIRHFLHNRKRPGKSCSGGSGSAPLGGRGMNISGPRLDTIVHEHGHSFGFNHSGLTMDYMHRHNMGTGYNDIHYGDVWSAMGAGYNADYRGSGIITFSGPHRLETGWLGTSNVFTAPFNQPSEVTLESLDSRDSSGLKSQAIKLVRVGVNAPFANQFNHSGVEPINIYLEYQHNINNDGSVIPLVHAGASEGELRVLLAGYFPNNTGAGGGITTKLVTELRNPRAGDVIGPLDMRQFDAGYSIAGGALPNPKYFLQDSPFYNLRIEILEVVTGARGSKALRLRVNSGQSRGETISHHYGQVYPPRAKLFNANAELQNVYSYSNDFVKTPNQFYDRGNNISEMSPRELEAYRNRTSYMATLTVGECGPNCMACAETNHQGSCMTNLTQPGRPGWTLARELDRFTHGSAWQKTKLYSDWFIFFKKPDVGEFIGYTYTQYYHNPDTGLTSEPINIRVNP